MLERVNADGSNNAASRSRSTRAESRVETRSACLEALCVFARDGNAEITGLDIGGLDNDGRMCGQLTDRAT